MATKRPADDVNGPLSREATAKRSRVEQPSTSEHTAESLLALLDLSALTSQEAIATRFDAIAEELLHHFRLRVVSSGSDGVLSHEEYEVLELEFYLYAPGCHEDPFTHGSEEQKRSGRWYFHRAPRRTAEPSTTTTNTSNAPRTATAAGGYRGGTRKGLDLTLGGPADLSAPGLQRDGPRGGALLRTLRRSDGKVISGPSLLVDEILAKSGVSKIAELVEDAWVGDTTAIAAERVDDKASMFFYALSSAVEGSRVQTYTSPRIGLDLSHPSIPLPTSLAATLAHPRAVFITKPYRYFTHPELLIVNGRGQTWLGVWSHLQKLSGEAGASANDAKPKTTKSLTDYFASSSASASSSSSTKTTPTNATLLAKSATIARLKPDTAKNYLETYERASSEAGALNEFVGPKGKGKTGTPTGFVRMVGALEGARKRLGGV